MVAVEDRGKLIQAESERLGDYLYRLPPEVFNQPSACEAWTVADVAAHLANGRLLFCL